MAGAQPGHIVDDRFELLSRIGTGGMGAVWRARDLALDREVAVKEVRPADPAAYAEPEAERKLRERVVREARALARIDHPNVVRVHHIVDAVPHPWLVMELLRGGSLDALASRGPLPPAEAARLGRDVLAGLRAAHAAGIHHRDVKPANILLREDGSAVLTDFGIAAVAGTTSLTVTGGIIGSPEYMAPERIRGAPDHAAADLWSLGITLYVLTEGRSPLRRGTTLATLSAVLEDPVPPPVASGPLAEVLGALLVKDPAARPDAARVDELLALAQRPGPPHPPPHPPPGPPPVPPRNGHPPAGWSTTTATAPEVPPRRSRTALVAGLTAGAVLLAGGVTAAVLLGGGTDGNGSAGPTTAPTATGPAPDEDGERPAGPGPTDEPVEEESPPEPSEDLTDREPPPEPDPDSTPDPEEPDQEQEQPDQEQEPDPEPGAGGPATGIWIAQLFSEPVGSGTAVRDQRLAAVRADIPEAEVLLSDDFPSLNPGYWVIYVSGGFDDGYDAVSFCAERGRTSGNECVGRYLGASAADAGLICHPENGGSGRCEDGQGG
ncbi:serine/threonine-protein kinase [Streptomyces marincola]|uniref:serine/threonine-protein kinase n=1 Tax=Streptomyces marincola TaxID=2878388 RepID=UPI001CF41A53|nr:serine/threonine-protein kinase [Streptomyces marincola]UCM87362.1 protein kinase [Streptomyces marincola]